MTVYAAEPPLAMCPSSEFEKSAVPLFSTKGRILAKRLGIHLPIRIMSLEAVDPPRDVHADRWHALFCKEWIDADRHCTMDGKITCRDRTVQEKTYYRPKQVECTKDVPFNESLRACAELRTEDGSHLDNGMDVGAIAYSAAFVSYDRDLKHWCYTLGEDALLPPPPSPQEKRAKVLYSKRNISCDSAWTKFEARISIGSEPARKTQPGR